MSTKFCCFALLVLMWLSSSDAVNCPVPDGVTFTKSGCCDNNACTAVCTGVTVACAAGYTGDATTADCEMGGTWSKDVSNICTKVCPTPTGSTVTSSNNCCPNNICVIGCDNVAITCMAAYSGDDVTANCLTGGTWSVANVANTCTADCPKQPGVTFTKTCCTDNSCDAGCTGVTVACDTGYSGTDTTADCMTTGDWSKNVTAICTQDTTTAATTTAATTTASGAGDLSMTKSIFLFVSSVMMLIF